MDRIKFLYETRVVAFPVSQSRGILEVAKMERENEIVELGSVSTETLGNFGPPVEIGGHERLAGIDLD